MAPLARLPRLEELHLLGFSGPLHPLTDLPHLVSLSLGAAHEFKFDDTSTARLDLDLQPLRRLLQLRTLHLRALRTLDADLLAHLPSLEDLHIDSTPAPDLSPLRDCPLQKLRVVDAGITSTSAYTYSNAVSDGDTCAERRLLGEFE